MEPSFNSVGGIIGVQDHLVVRPSIEARSLQEFAKWRQFNKMRFDLVYWLEVVHSALVREIYSILFFNVANIISSDLPLRNSKKIFIDLFCVLGNLKHFLFFFIPTGPKKSRFCHFLATCK